MVLESSQKDQLFKSIQLFATRLSSRNWSANSDTLSYFSIISLFMVICTVLLFFFCVNPNLRVCHWKQLIPPFATTASFYNSLFVSSATLRNSLPALLYFVLALTLLRTPFISMAFLLVCKNMSVLLDLDSHVKTHQSKG